MFSGIPDNPTRSTDHTAIDFVGSFETTFQPSHDRDVAETTEHDVRFGADIDLLHSLGVTRVRHATRWHRIERSPGDFDWRSTDLEMAHLRERGMRPIVDLVHHTSHPAWLTDGFADPRFPDAYLRFTEAVATRYPWIEGYTLFNEPFSTLFLAGHEGIWPPHHTGMRRFVQMLTNVLPAVAEASRMYRDLLPGATHLYNDTCESHQAADDGDAALHTRMVNDRRHFVLDALLGRVEEHCTFLPMVLEAGGERLLHVEPASVDVLGLDYYAHSQWEFHSEPSGGVVPASQPVPLARQIEEYHRRYGLPCMLAETNIRGYASDRASWLKYTLEQCEIAQSNGVPMDGYCWFPFIDSADWDSLLHHCDGNIDPVGVYWLDERLDRRESSMSRSYSSAAAGTPAADLPAYRFQQPVARWLRGYLPQMAHWDWQDPPPHEVDGSCDVDTEFELRVRDVA